MMLNGMQTKEYPTSYSIAELTNTLEVHPAVLACLLAGCCLLGRRPPTLPHLSVSELSDH
jgi:hypothetical protein